MNKYMCTVTAWSFVVLSVRSAQTREGAIWARGAGGEAAGDPEESGEEFTCVHAHCRRRWGFHHSDKTSCGGRTCLEASRAPGKPLWGSVQLLSPSPFRRGRSQICSSSFSWRAYAKREMRSIQMKSRNCLARSCLPLLTPEALWDCYFPDVVCLLDRTRQES